MAKARRELIMLIVGLIMIISGVSLLLSKANVNSAFLQSSGVWHWWNTLLTLIPLVAGIVFLTIKPDWVVSKIIALLGAIVIVVAIIASLTITVNKPITTFQWILIWVLSIGGFIVSALSLLFRKKR